MKEIIIAILTAFLTYVLGSSIYFKQKEYELIRHRYLEEGIDLLCTNVEHALSVFRSNWTRSLWILKQFRDLGKESEKKLCQNKFLILDYRSFLITPFHRLNFLINDRIFWQATQSLFAFVENANSFFEHDLCCTIRLYIETDKLKETHKNIAADYFNAAYDLDKKSHKYYLILEELLNIGAILEKEKLSFKKLKIFKSRKEVKQSIDKLKNAFKEDLH